MRKCSKCRRTCVPNGQWRSATPEQREEWKAAGLARFDSRGMCGACRCRATRNGTLIDHERTYWRAEDLWEEWQHMADPLAPVMAECRRLSVLLGVSPKRLYNVARENGWQSRFHGGWGQRVRADWKAA